MGLDLVPEKMLHRLVGVRLQDMLVPFWIPTPATDHHIGRWRTEDSEKDRRSVEVVVDVAVVKGRGGVPSLPIAMLATLLGAKANALPTEESAAPSCPTERGLTNRCLEVLVALQLSHPRLFILGEHLRSNQEFPKRIVRNTIDVTTSPVASTASPITTYLANFGCNMFVWVRDVPFRVAHGMARSALGTRDVVGFTTHLPLAPDRVGLFCNVLAPKVDALVHVLLGDSASLEVGLQGYAACKGSLVRVG